MKYSELYRILKKNGCYIQRHGANHDLWVNPKTKRTALVSRHASQEAAVGTLRSIVKNLIEEAE